MTDVIKRGKHSVLKRSTEKDTTEEPFVNEIRLQKGLRLTSIPEGIFLHITSNGETKTTQLTADSTDPFALDLYNWAQSLVRARTYN